MLAFALGAIPSHRERALSKEDLVARISTSSGSPASQAEPALEVALELLRLFDLCRESDGHFALAGQTQTYCRNALVWFIEHDQSLLSNWERHGTAREDISLSNLLEQAPYFLKAVEERRKELATRKSLPMVASREQPCSVVLFKAVHQGKTYLLHQWDQKAERYQLIGGKQRSNENPEETAAREAIEEVARAQLVLGKTLFLTRAPIESLDEWEVSRTYGALTHYKIDIFSARSEVPQFLTSETDLWISIEEMLSGKTFANASIASLGGRLARNHRQYIDSLSPAMDFGPQLRVSAPNALPAPSHTHGTEPEIPEHLSLGWFLRLLRTLSLHELALVVSAIAAVIGASFAVGRFYEAKFARSGTAPIVTPDASSPSPSQASSAEQ